MSPRIWATLTAELASAFESAMRRAGLRYSVDCPPLPEPVYVDQEMWEKVVLNLLSNALKYTFDGEVRVRLSVRDGGAELSIADSGTGIPEDQLPYLFERFHRVDGARGRTQEGTGIGLAVVSELTKLHGGTVGVRSEVGGKHLHGFVPFGSAHLPQDRLRAPRTLASTALRAESYVGEAARWLPDVAASTPVTEDPDLAAAARNAPAVDAKPDGRILVVDDNADMRGYIARLLASRYEVELVANGEEALAGALRHPPDLVLSDVMMPRLDGFELMRALRANPRTSSLPVILLSARAGEEARIEGLDEGATDYLVKPFTARELLARVGAHLEMARARRGAAQREADLRAEAERARDRVISILESITDGFFTLDSEWRFTYVNDAAVKLLGKPLEDILGRSHWELYSAAVGSLLEREYRRAVRDKVPVDFENLYEPWQRWFSIKAYPAETGGLSVYFRDITEHKLAGQTARESQDRLRAMADLTRSVVEASPYAVEVLDGDGQTVLINHQGRQLRAAGVSWLEFWSDRDRAKAEECFATVLAGNSAHFAASTVASGGATAWLEVSATPLLDADGDVSRVLCITRDVTAERKAEEDLRQTAKLESLGVMAGGIAHDFNNLLTGILGNASLLSDVVPEPDRDLAEDIILASERAADLTRQMLAFAGKGRFQITKTDMSNLVRELLRLVRPSIERNVEIRLELQEGCIVEGDASQLQQVIMNLLINAGEAMEGTPGLIVVRTGKSTEAEGEFVYIEVTDNGKGMDEATQGEDLRSVLHHQVHGARAGSRGGFRYRARAQRNDGVQSEPGLGTMFRVLFPSFVPKPAEEESSSPARKTLGVVLLVDDEAIVRRVGGRF